MNLTEANEHTHARIRVNAAAYLPSHVGLFVTSWTVTHQVPLSMGFSREEYWSRWPFLSPGDHPNPGIEPGSPGLQADSLPAAPPELYFPH